MSFLNMAHGQCGDVRKQIWRHCPSHSESSTWNNSTDLNPISPRAHEAPAWGSPLHNSDSHGSSHVRPWWRLWEHHLLSYNTWGSLYCLSAEQLSPQQIIIQPMGELTTNLVEEPRSPCKVQWEGRRGWIDPVQSVRGAVGRHPVRRKAGTRTSVYTPTVGERRVVIDAAMK